MIKINKDLSQIPTSLKLPHADNFENSIPRTSKTTNQRRIEVIQNEGYIYHKNYDSRYKYKDIKNSLKNLYSHKCAFCENMVEMYHVEHYRRKSKYYWLAFSWDNLLLACGYCNIYKLENFRLSGDEFLFEYNDDNINQINELSTQHDQVELPFLINPEVTDPRPFIAFEKSGVIESANERMIYTIETCKLDRKYLNDARRKIIDDFRKDINSAIVDADSIHDQKTMIRAIVLKFINDFKNYHNTFLTFRKFVIDNWITGLVDEVVNS